MCGALRRTYELHRRLQRRFDITALVTEEFPGELVDSIPRIRLISTGRKRNTMLKIREVLGNPFSRYTSGEDFRIWMEEVPPSAPRIRVPLLVQTVHDLRHTSGLKYLGLLRYLSLTLGFRRSLARASAVVTVSSCIKTAVQNRYSVPEDSVYLIPNGIAPELARKSMLPGRILEDDYILAAGHLERRKNLGILIKAFAMVADAWKGSLVLAGKRSRHTEVLESIAAELGLSDRVVFTGSVSETELRTLLRDCEILACPASCEGFGMTLLEGMAMGRPVVASKIPAHEEVGGDAVLLVDTGPEMPQALGRAITSLLNNRELRRQLVSAGYRKIKKFSWDESSDKLSALYKSLFEQK